MEKMIAPLTPNDHIPVRNRKRLTVNTLPAERISIGNPNDYKPCVALLPDGELLVVAFDSSHVPIEGNKFREDMILFRSGDGGKTWSDRQVIELFGREPYFSVLKDGTILITAHLLDQDIRNIDGYVHAYIHRSADKGNTWHTVKITPEDFPIPTEKVRISDGILIGPNTSRNILELQDGTLIVGVSAPRGTDYLWRSKDKGETWDKSLSCQFEGVDTSKLWWPFMCETFFWQTRNGDILGLFRVDQTIFPSLPDSEMPPACSDQFERLVVYRSKNGGRSWTKEPELGSYYGEMYPAILRLKDGLLLLTFTVRSLCEPLGMQAVLGEETPDGFVFDFEHDRLILDAKTPIGMFSGGGFGPTLQLSDSTLVTSYSYRGSDGHTHVEVVRWRISSS